MFDENSVTRCPGEECPRWRDAFGETFEEKAKVCRGCHFCHDNPPIFDVENSETEIDDLVDEVKRLISLNDCGIAIDWESKDFKYFLLFQFWRECEKNLENYRLAKTENFQETILKYLGFQ